MDSAAINRLRLPLALAIIMIHLHTQVDIINELAAIAVPLFFMMSGFLFFRGRSPECAMLNALCIANRSKLGRGVLKEPGGSLAAGADSGGESVSGNGQWSTVNYFPKFRRRVRSLLFPYVLFCLLAVIGLIINHTLHGHSLTDSIHTFLGNGRWLHNFWDVHTTGQNTNVLGITKPVSYPILIPLWFIRDLMVIVLMAPLIGWAIRCLRIGWIAVMVVLSITGIWIPLVGFSPSSCLWFSIGAWFSINGISMASSLRRVRIPLICAAIALLVLDILTDGRPADRYVHFAFLLMAVPATYAIAVRDRSILKLDLDLNPVRDRSILKLDLANVQCSMFNVRWSTASLSFFIFAFHTLSVPFLGRPVELSKQLLFTGSDSELLCILQSIGAALLTAVICIMAYFLMLLICPKFLSLLTGGRVKKIEGLKN
ncbi:MAG: acyltransferase family protein [Bacteroidaceae bacterium]|nr:acyltransferase family protein [Bacteroidaceae bacterium]